MFHGSCDDADEELFPDAFESRFHESAKDSPYQIHIMGHSHEPYSKIVVIIPDSVGRLFDEDLQVSFVIFLEKFN